MKEHKVKLAIIKMLCCGNFVSGETIGTELGISRAAVGKHIKGLLSWGLDIYSVHGKGYRLSQPLELLESDVIQKLTKNRVEVISVIDSTNQYLLDRIDSLESGKVCIAEYQSQGRGRRGRQWISPFGSNLYLSMYWRLEAGIAAAMGLSLVVGVAVAEALEFLGLKGIKLKWPNDLYYQDKKLAGILVEMSGQAGGAADLVIGLGLNINMPESVEGIDQPWTSLSSVSRNLTSSYKLPSKNELAATLINKCSEAISDYEYNGMQGFIARWNRLDNFLNRQAKLAMGNREVHGIVRGINEQGAVLIETDKGLESFVGGEISLRKE